MSMHSDTLRKQENSFGWECLSFKNKSSFLKPVSTIKVLSTDSCQNLTIFCRSSCRVKVLQLFNFTFIMMLTDILKAHNSTKMDPVDKQLHEYKK